MTWNRWRGWCDTESPIVVEGNVPLESVCCTPKNLVQRALCYIRRIWLAWEKLRIWYNVVLLAEGLLGLLILRLLVTYDRQLLYGCGLWVLVFLVGLFANIFYFLGPIMEMILCVIIRSRAVLLRPYLFLACLFFWMYVIFCMGARMWDHGVGDLNWG